MQKSLLSTKGAAMMNKQNVYTIMGIALSFIIAVGGWVLTSALIDRKSDALLSATGITRVNVLPIEPRAPVNQDGSGVDDSLIEQPKLTNEEIIKVLQNWQSEDCDRIAHEPVEGQLSMEQAIEIGKAGLSYYNEQGIIPVELLEYENAKIGAHLFENQPGGQTTLSLYPALDPYYSYWSVSFSNELMDTVLTINAVTGQIWIADIITHTAVVNFNAASAGIALNAFMSHIGISSDEKTLVKYDENEISASQSFAGGMLHAAVNIKARINSVTTVGSAKEESIIVYMRIRMNLTTQTLDRN